METTLHRQLKTHFSEPHSRFEEKLGRYRIDVITGDRLIEIQQSGLAAIRGKVGKLLESHEVDVVKPLVIRKRLVKLARKAGPVVSRRWSPKKGSILDLFDELIYFARVFPHPNLRLIVPLVEIEETRFPGHGRRRRWRRNDFVIEDRALTKIVGMGVFRDASDLQRLIPAGLTSPFDTSELAGILGIPRWQARKIAWVMHKTDAVMRVGKRGNSHLYELTSEGTSKWKAKPKRKTKPGRKSKMAKPKASKSVRKTTARKSKAVAKKKAASKLKTPAGKTARKKAPRRSAVAKEQRPVPDKGAAVAVAAVSGEKKKKAVKRRVDRKEGGKAKRKRTAKSVAAKKKTARIVSEEKRGKRKAVRPRKNSAKKAA